MNEVVDASLHLPKTSSNTGPFADYSEVTRLSGTVVIRQRVVLSDPANPDNHATISEDGALTVEPGPQLRDSLQILQSIETLLARQVWLLQNWLEIDSADVCKDDV